MHKYGAKFVFLTHNEEKRSAMQDVLLIACLIFQRAICIVVDIVLLVAVLHTIPTYHCQTTLYQLAAIAATRNVIKIILTAQQNNSSAAAQLVQQRTRRRRHSVKNCNQDIILRSHSLKSLNRRGVHENVMKCARLFGIIC